MLAKKVRADMLLRQLLKRHTTGNNPEVFFTEVKNGSSWFSDNLMRLDAVAIKRSWKNPCITGYEVKVDRQDFLRDDKWPGYLKYCHRFSFACPAGLILPEELPDEVGLIYYNPERDSISTKRKAPFRVIEIPWEMLYYLVISRIDSDRHPFFSSQREYFEAFVQDKASRRELGMAVRSKLLSQLDELGKHVKRLNRQLDYQQSDIERLKALESILAKHGLGAFRWNLERDLEAALSRGMPANMAEHLKQISFSVGELMRAVESERGNSGEAQA